MSIKRPEVVSTDAMTVREAAGLFEFGCLKMSDAQLVHACQVLATADAVKVAWERANQTPLPAGDLDGMNLFALRRELARLRHKRTASL